MSKTILIIPVLLFASLVQAATIDVSTFADEYDTSGTGTGCSLREAVQAAGADLSFGGCPAGSGDDTINLQSGTYALTLTGTFTGLSEVSQSLGDLDINSNVEIIGRGNAETMISGGGVTNLFDILAGKTVRLVDLLVTNGGLHGTSGVQFGGCIINRGNLTLERVVVDTCDSSPPSSGPGTATYGGGGIYSMRIGSLILLQSAVIDSTTTGNGGGIYVEGSYQITNSTIDNNRAGGSGGGIYVGGRTWGATSLTNTTVASNTAGVGTDREGGIYQIRCGDGVVDAGVVYAGETCDDGSNNGQPNRCNLTCNGIMPPPATEQNPSAPITEAPAIPVTTKEASAGPAGPATESPASGGCGQIASGKISGDGKAFFYIFLSLSLGLLLLMRKNAYKKEVGASQSSNVSRRRINFSFDPSIKTSAARSLPL